MLPKEQKGSVSSSSSLSEESEFDPNSVKKPLIQESSKNVSPKGENAPEKKVRCRYCLKRDSTQKNIKTHVMRWHKEFQGKCDSKKSKYFIAEHGQKIPDDPEYQL